MQKKKTLASRIIGIVLDVILVLMVLYIGITLYLRSSTGNPQASLFGITTHVVISDSMEPNLSEGDIIIVKKDDAYEVGDVITYIRDDGLSITHRVISVDFDGYTVQGDANPSPDEGAIRHDQIVGKVIGKMSGGGWIASFKSP